MKEGVANPSPARPRGGPGRGPNTSASWARLPSSPHLAPGDDADEPASTNTAADEAPEYNEDMKLDELKEVAARYGVDASAMRKKADVIAAIKAAKAEQPDDGADDEEPPQIGAADPV